MPIPGVFQSEFCETLALTKVHNSFIIHKPSCLMQISWSSRLISELSVDLLPDLQHIPNSFHQYSSHPQPAPLIFKTIHPDTQLENHCSESLLLKHGAGTIGIDTWGGTLAKVAATELLVLYGPLCQVCCSSHQEGESVSLPPESGLDRLWLTDCGRHGISEPRPQDASLSSLTSWNPETTVWTCGHPSQPPHMWMKLS